jgi:putative membrane protein
LGYIRAWRALPIAQARMILLLAAAVVLANIRQPYPGIAPLQHVPTVLAILFAPVMLRRWPLSNGAIGCILAFLLLHTLAGRYTYSNIPYDAWGRAAFGISIDQNLGLTRNNFDRLVHLAFGLFAIRPYAEASERHGGTGPRAALLGAFLFVGAISALYEVFEWGLTMLLAPELADQYNGQQGDIWDAQKDMACAMAGGLAVTLFSGLARPWRGRRAW